MVAGIDGCQVHSWSLQLIRVTSCPLTAVASFSCENDSHNNDNNNKNNDNDNNYSDSSDNSNNVLPFQSCNDDSCGLAILWKEKKILHFSSITTGAS